MHGLVGSLGLVIQLAASEEVSDFRKGQIKLETSSIYKGHISDGEISCLLS